MDVDLRRNLSRLPFPGEAELRAIAGALFGLHPSVQALLVSEHERTLPDSSVFDVTPWDVGAASDFIVGGRPAFTIEAFRLSSSSTFRGQISAHVIGPESIREVGVWSHRELVKQGRPRRVKVHNGTVSSCFDRLIFGSEGLRPDDHIEVWAHPATAWEQRTTKSLAPMRPRSL